MHVETGVCSCLLGGNESSCTSSVIFDLFGINLYISLIFSVSRGRFLPSLTANIWMMLPDFFWAGLLFQADLFSNPSLYFFEGIPSWFVFCDLIQLNAFAISIVWSIAFCLLFEMLLCFCHFLSTQLNCLFLFESAIIIIVLFKTHIVGLGFALYEYLCILT